MRVNMVKPLSVVVARNSQVVIWQSTRVFRATPYVVPANPRTVDQMAVRGFMGEAKRAWGTLDALAKRQWSVFAQDQFYLSNKDYVKRWRGIDAFCRASVARQVSGFSPLPQVPEEGRPEGVKSVKLLPGADARELAFTMVHKEATGNGLWLLVRVTPTSPSPGRMPYEKQLRYVRGTGPQSVLPLPESGEVVRMGGVRFELEVGMPYAVEVRIMRAADGAVSDAYYQIGLREEGAGGDAELRAKIKARGEEIARVYGGRLLSKAETEAEALTRSHGGTEKSKNEGDLRKDVNELTNDEEGSLLWQLGCEWFPSWECRDSYKHKFEWGDAKEWIQ